MISPIHPSDKAYGIDELLYEAEAALRVAAAQAGSRPAKQAELQALFDSMTTWISGQVRAAPDSPRAGRSRPQDPALLLILSHRLLRAEL